MAETSITPTAGSVVRNETDGIELEVRSDVNAAAVAAREEATVRARVLLARANPRDWDVVRSRVLRECSRPGFAKVAMYALPRGGKVVDGLSIRFAESIARLAGNLWVNSQIVSETREHRLVEVFAMDLETNFTESQQAILGRTVERKAQRDGSAPNGAGTIVGERRNSFGDKVFLCIATDEEMLTKTNSLVSRIRRNKILEMVPADILDDAKAAIRRITADDAAKDPEATRKALLDSFAAQGVGPDAVKSYVLAAFGTRLEALKPEHVAELRNVYFAVRDGMATWESFVSVVAPTQAAAPKTGEVVTAPQLPADRVQTVELAFHSNGVPLTAEQVTRIEPQLETPAASQVVDAPKNAVLKAASVVPFPAATVAKTTDELVAEIREIRAMTDAKEKASKLKRMQAVVTKLPVGPDRMKLTKHYLAAVSGAPEPVDA